MPDYELLRIIGRGSYGDVWLVRNVLGQFRAIKFIYRERFADARPFEREFEGIQCFEPISRSHPSQLHILHVGKNDAADCFYYVMELADAVPEVRAGHNDPAAPGVGRPPAGSTSLDPDAYAPHTLRSDLERHGRLSPADCVQIGLSLATALAHLHTHQLVHRDIKPSNVIFVNGLAKLGDIGLVTDAGDTQSIVGTEGYLPPEGPGTPQADLYSLGKVLYEIGTGMDRRRFAELPEGLRTWPDANAVVEFNEIVLRACAKDPAQRYASADEIRKDLEWLQSGKSVKSARTSARRWAATRKLMVAVGVAAAAAFIVASLWSSSKPTDDAEGGPPSTNSQANLLCSKALRTLRVDSYRSFGEVYTNLHRAIRLDPNFAKPYVGLLELVLREGKPGFEIPSSENERTIAARLMKLAPESAAAHCGQAILSYCDLDFPRAEQHARRAIQVEPKYELGHTWYGFMLENWMRPVEARQQLEFARGVNDSKVQIFRCLAHSYYAERNFPRAIELYREGIELSPNDFPCFLSMGRAYRAMGDYLEAIDVFENMEIRFGKASQLGRRFDRLRQAFEQGGKQGYWEEELRQWPSNGLFTGKAEIQFHLGNIPAALDILEESYRSREQREGVHSGLPGLLFDEYTDRLWDEPRFQALVDKIGFFKVNPKLKRHPTQ